MVNNRVNARINPSIRLTTITITLSRHDPPIVEMRGEIDTGKRMIDQAGVAIITTQHLSKLGKEFIDEIRADYTDYALRAKRID